MGYEELEEQRDSRERIEADLLALTKKWHDYDGDFMKIYSSVAYAQVKELLDRQAALTEREICKWWRDEEAKHDERIHRISELQSKVEELQAKVDELNAQNTRLSAKWAQALERVGKLEEELDHARSCPDCDCCGWKEKVDELRAERDKYKRHMWEYSMWHESTARMLGIGFDPENLPSDDEVQGEIERRICELQTNVDELRAELDELRPSRIVEFAEQESDEPPYDELLRCLENDWHISASWDGLRGFWNIELDDGETYCGATIEEWHELAVRMEAERDVLNDKLMTALNNQKNLEDRLWEYDGTHMLLPVDADGVPIHVGDKMEYADGTVFEVDGIGSGGTLFSVDDGSNSAWWTNAEGKRHVPERTVEDVLREIVELAQYPSTGKLDDGDIEGFAAEIRELMEVDG